MKWEVKYTVDDVVGGKTEHETVIEADSTIREAARISHGLIVRTIRQRSKRIRDVTI